MDQVETGSLSTATAAASIAPPSPPPDPAEVLRTRRYARFVVEPLVSLFTFRRPGLPVPTPVRMAPYAGRLFVWAYETDGKVERVRNHPQVQLAPCDERGNLLDEPVTATARIMLPEEMPVLPVAMRAKYGWLASLERSWHVVARALFLRRGGAVGIEITLD